MLKQRILTALVLLPLMLGMLFWAGPHLWAVFCGLIGMLVLWEISRLAKLSSSEQKIYLAASLLLGIIASLSPIQWPDWLVFDGLILFFWLVVAPVWLYRQSHIQSRYALALLGWLLVYPFWVGLTYLRELSAGFLLCVMGLVWVADTGAYFFGRRFGRHKLAPAISPGKSREGALGGLACVLVYTFIVHQVGWLADDLMSDLSAWQIFFGAILLTAVSIEGDLFESWLKRCASVKDSSQLLPGHGGVFDRTDSLIAVLSVTVALLGWMAR